MVNSRVDWNGYMYIHFIHSTAPQFKVNIHLLIGHHCHIKVGGIEFYSYRLIIHSNTSILLNTDYFG